MTTDKRLYTSVVRRIIEMIDSGQFPPGSRLPGERDLAAQLGVSRVTVREAQIALQAQKRIEVRTGSGARVLPTTARTEALPTIEAFELTQARALFESEAAALAATLITDEQVRRLETLVDTMGDAEVESSASHDADREFHLLIARACNNAAIVDTIERLWLFRTEIPQIRNAYESICILSPEDRRHEHQDIVDALKARDPGKARHAMRKHFTCIIETMLTTAEKNAIDEVRRRTSESRQRFLEGAELTQ